MGTRRLSMAHFPLFYRLFCNQSSLLLCFLLVMCFAPGCFSSPLPAAIAQNLVLFSPVVAVGSDNQSCTGVRVGKGVLLTSSECAQAITQELLAGVPVVALDREMAVLGQAVTSSPGESDQGLLDVVDRDYVPPEAGGFPSLVSFQASDPWSAVAFAFYPADQGVVAANTTLHYEEVSNGRAIYKTESHLPLPPGAPVGNQVGLICIAGLGDSCAGFPSPVTQPFEIQKRSLAGNASVSPWPISSEPVRLVQAGELDQATGWWLLGCFYVAGQVVGWMATPIYLVEVFGSGGYSEVCYCSGIVAYVFTSGLAAIPHLLVWLYFKYKIRLPESRPLLQPNT